MKAQEIIEESSKPDFKKQKIKVKVTNSEFDKILEEKKRAEELKKSQSIEKPKSISKPKKIRFLKLKQILAGLKQRITIQDNKNKVKFVFGFIAYSFVYGLIINYLMWGVFGAKFGIFTFPAYGILFHFIKEELPRIWIKFWPSRK